MTNATLDMLNKPYLPWRGGEEVYDTTKCEVCGKVLRENWCTRNVCQACCEAGKCSIKHLCKVYPDIETRVRSHNKESVIENPSKRVKI